MQESNFNWSRESSIFHQKCSESVINIHYPVSEALIYEPVKCKDNIRKTVSVTLALIVLYGIDKSLA